MKYKKIEFVDNSLDSLLKLGLILDARAWNTVGNKIHGKILKKILQNVNY